jgi:tRNA-specific 2-thiouridylase
MLSGEDLAYMMFPVGFMQKSDVRQLGVDFGLRTATKPDSQDVCFIGSTIGRAGFLEPRLSFNAAEVVDQSGAKVGEVSAVELVTLGQRRGLGLGGGDKRYVVAVDVPARRVTVGDEASLFVESENLRSMVWPHKEDEQLVLAGEVLVQGSAHGERAAARIEHQNGSYRMVWARPNRRIAPGQTVVFYDKTDQVVLGGGIVAA